MIMGKPIDKKDTDQRTVTEYLRDTNPTAYAAMMRRETVQPSTTLTNVGWVDIKRDVAENRLLGVMLNGSDHYDGAEYAVLAQKYAETVKRKIGDFQRQVLGRWLPATHDESVFAKAVDKIAKTGTQAPSYLGPPTTLQNFDAFIRARLREMYPETDGVPPLPKDNPFLARIKKEPAPPGGRRYIEPVTLVKKDDALFFGGVRITADPTLKPNEARMVVGYDPGVEPTDEPVCGDPECPCARCAK